MADGSPLSYQRLRYFLRVAELGSVRAAAEELGKDASAVSRAVATLEQECGATLLQRSGGVSATAIGELVSGYARRQVLQQGQLLERLRNIQAANIGHVELVAGEGFIDWLMSVALPPFLEERPGVTLNLTIASSDVIVNQIVEEQADLGLVFLVPGNEWIRSHAASRVSVCVLVGKGHPLGALGRPLTLSDLQDYRGIMPQKHLGVRQLIQVAGASDGVALREVVTTSSFHALHEFAGNGLGCALTVAAATGLTVSTGEIEVLPMANPILHQGSVQLISKHARTLSPAAIALMTAIKRTFADFGTGA
jgi:DNA-binding transcriptional LysR family regulator